MLIKAIFDRIYRINRMEIGPTLCALRAGL